MFLSSAIKDYIEYLNNIYDSLPSLINFISQGKNISFQGNQLNEYFSQEGAWGINFSFISSSVVYILNSLKFCFFYIISFQWFHDFLYLPVILPKIYPSLNQNFSFTSLIDLPKIHQLIPNFLNEKEGIINLKTTIFPWEQERNHLMFSNLISTPPKGGWENISSSLGEGINGEGVLSANRQFSFQTLGFENSSLISQASFGGFEFLRTHLSFLNQASSNFFIGFFNSLLICLPVCSSHFICIRALLIHGPIVGFFSFLGLALGNIIFLISVIYGWRWIIVPWFSLEPINYIFGLLTLIIISYNLLHEKQNIRGVFNASSAGRKESENFSDGRFSPIRGEVGNSKTSFGFSKAFRGEVTVEQSAQKQNFLIFLKNSLFFFNRLGKRLNQFLLGNRTITISSINIKYFGFLLILVWTEQAILFPFLTNLNLGISSTVLNGFGLSGTGINGVGSYFLGLVLGLCFFSFIIAIVIMQSTMFIPKIFNITYSSFVQKCNTILILLLLTFGFSSIPYYGLDYLFLGPLGFVANDKSITSLIPNNDFKDSYRILGGYSTNTDISLFDSAKYLLEHQSEIKMEQSSFEELNYQADYMWSTRSDRIFRIYQRTQSEFLKKITNLFSPASQTQTKQEEAKDALPPSTQLDYKPAKTTSILRNNLDNRLLLPEYATILSRISKFSFNNMFFRNNQNNLNSSVIQTRFKQKYYSNPIFFNLLNFKIDTLMQNSPKTNQLNHFQQTDLFQKRMILSNYYDSINFYKFIPYYFEFQEVFAGSKTFAHRPYHHQFKGTLKNIQSLKWPPLILVDQQTHSPQEKPSEKKILPFRPKPSDNSPSRRGEAPQGGFSPRRGVGEVTFDMPLYKTSNKQAQAKQYFHEEFPSPLTVPSGPSRARRARKGGIESEVGGRDTPGRRFASRSTSSSSGQSPSRGFAPSGPSGPRRGFVLSKNVIIGGDVQAPERSEGASPPQLMPDSQRDWKFLNLNLIAPFYMGWNEQTRLFILSNQYSNLS